MSQLKDRRTSMRVTAENIVLNSGEWFTQNGEPAEFGKNRTLRFSGHP